MSLLSSDILHRVFNFFVSDNKIVDGESLRVASVVCKQWQEVVNSRSLWATPVGSNECCGSKNPFHTVYQSLQIKEQVGDPLSNEYLIESSLLGFVNIQCYDGKVSDLYFFVRERATGSEMLLSISRDGQKNPSLIRDLYVNHFELKGEFLLRDSNNKSENFFPKQRFPLGITVWKGRVIRWYKVHDQREAREIIDLISAKGNALLHDKLSFPEPKKSISLVRHLMDLENTLLRDRKSMSFYAEGRQHMVDWVS